MRIVGDIPHPNCKITLFSWNNRYLIKVERGLLEQTYKIDQTEIHSESELISAISESFIQETLLIFDQMEKSLIKAMNQP